MENETLRHVSIEPSHPGELLSEIVIPGTGRSKVDIASLLGISRQTLYDILSEKAAVTPEMAVRLGSCSATAPDLWLRMQTAHDLWHAQRTIDVESIPTLTAA